MQGHIFDFRSEVQTGSGPSQYNVGIILVEYPTIEKTIKNRKRHVREGPNYTT